MMCRVCNKPAEHHHVKTRGSGGGDEVWNLMPLCRYHHQEVHKIGLNKFSIMHGGVKDWLIDNRWEKDHNGKWRHYGD